MAATAAETLNKPTDIVSIVESDATPFIAANAKHRAKITGEARHALTLIGLSEDEAGKVVDAIVASAVPHVSIRF